MATTVTLKPNAIDLSGSTSGTTTLQATAVAGTTTVTLPAATDTLVGKATTDTLTNKTLTTPVISTISNTGTLTLPTSTDTLVGRATTDTLTNKTLTTPTISSLSSASATALTLQSAGTTAVTIDTSQRVGIGTTSPSNKLSVSGSGGVQTDIIDTGGANATLRTTNSTNTTWFGTDGATPAVGPVANASLLWGFGSYPILLATNNAERMRIDSSGNVGIGASSPNSYGAGYTVLQSAGSTGGLVQATGNSNAIIMEMHGNTSSGNGEVGTRTNTSVTIKTNNTERMRIDTSGNLGIGTATPAGNLQISGSGDRSLLVTGGASGTISVQLGDSAAAGQGGMSYDNAVDALFLKSNGSERMRIDSSGTVMVNSTAQVDFAKFQVVGATSSNNLVVLQDTGTTYSTSQFYQKFLNSSAAVAGSIQHTAVTTVAFSTTSDGRLKEDKGVATDMSVIDNTVIHNFVWKLDGLVDRGIFAQEAHLIKPTAISVGNDELTEDGNLRNPWGVDYSKYVPDLIVYCQQLKKITQEQQATINALTARLVTLENK
jgi:hypothetical protein